MIDIKTWLQTLPERLKESLSTVYGLSGYRVAMEGEKWLTQAISMQSLFSMNCV